jgi:hypothetical protein
LARENERKQSLKAFQDDRLERKIYQSNLEQSSDVNIGSLSRNDKEDKIGQLDFKQTENH